MPKPFYDQLQHSSADIPVSPDTTAVMGIQEAVGGARIQAEQLDTSREAENFTLLKSLVSEEALKLVVHEIDTALRQPNLIEIGERVAEKEALDAAGRETDRTLGYSAAKELYDQATIISDYLWSPEVESDFMEYTNLVTAKSRAERGVREVTGDSTEATSLIDVLTSSPQTGVNANAPFANYQNNDDTAWQNVEDSTVREFLASQQFVDTHGFGYGCNSVVLKHIPDKPYEVPLSAVVSAAGFESWLGRDPRDQKNWSSPYGAGSMQSLSVIKHYAGLETELPPVDKMNVYIQPDGQVFCDNSAGDSHRIAAALLRGQDTVQANKLEFILLNRNRLPVQQ